MNCYPTVSEEEGVGGGGNDKEGRCLPFPCSYPSISWNIYIYLITKKEKERKDKKEEKVSRPLQQTRRDKIKSADVVTEAKTSIWWLVCPCPLTSSSSSSREKKKKDDHKEMSPKTRRITDQPPPPLPAKWLTNWRLLIASPSLHNDYHFHLCPVFVFFIQVADVEIKQTTRRQTRCQPTENATGKINIIEQKGRN